MYEHFKWTQGQGLLAKDEAHAFSQKILSCNGRDNNKELNSEILCKFHDGKPWLMTEGRQGKRDVQKQPALHSVEPHSFLSKGVFFKIAKAGDGLFERILMAAPMPNLLPPQEVQRYIGQLEATGVTELSCVFDGIFTQHQSGESRIYELSNRAKIAYNEYCSQVVEEQNARFQGGSTESGQSSSSSKDTKHVLRLSVILHVLFHAID